MAKISLLRQEQKEHLEGEVGKAKRGTGAGIVRQEAFRDRVFTYSSSRLWTDSFDRQL